MPDITDMQGRFLSDHRIESSQKKGRYQRNEHPADVFGSADFGGSAEKIAAGAGGSEAGPSGESEPCTATDTQAGDGDGGLAAGQLAEPETEPEPEFESVPEFEPEVDVDRDPPAVSDGVVVIASPASAADKEKPDPVTAIMELVEQPAKVMRIGSMIKQLLDEVRSAPLDEAGRVRLKEIHARSIKELEDGLAPELVDELDRLTLPFTESSAPSESELRIAQAQLVGWLEGLFHGIQTALFAQQMAARAQFEEMRRRAGIGGSESEAGIPGMFGSVEDSSGRGVQHGPYL